MLSFSSAFFDAVITTTMTDAAPADNVEAPAKDSSNEEAVDRIAGAVSILETLAAANKGGSSSLSKFLNTLQTSMYHNHTVRLGWTKLIFFYFHFYA